MVEGERHSLVGANSSERQAFVCGHDQVGLVLRSGGKRIVDVGRALRTAGGQRQPIGRRRRNGRVGIEGHLVGGRPIVLVGCLPAVACGCSRLVVEEAVGRGRGKGLVVGVWDGGHAKLRELAERLNARAARERLVGDLLGHSAAHTLGDERMEIERVAAARGLQRSGKIRLGIGRRSRGNSGGRYATGNLGRGGRRVGDRRAVDGIHLKRDWFGRENGRAVGQRLTATGEKRQRA